MLDATLSSGSKVNFGEGELALFFTSATSVLVRPICISGSSNLIHVMRLLKGLEVTEACIHSSSRLSNFRVTLASRLATTVPLRSSLVLLVELATGHILAPIKRWDRRDTISSTCRDWGEALLSVSEALVRRTHSFTSHSSVVACLVNLKTLCLLV
jgi:hypothetical protein